MSEATGKEGGEEIKLGKGMEIARLSSRGGALVLRSISLFFARGHKVHKKKDAAAATSSNAENKAASSAPQNASITRKCKRNKMTEKISNKSTLSLLENLRMNTHFNKDEIEALFKIYRKLVNSSKLNIIHMYSANVPHSSIISKTSQINEGVDRIVFQELLHNSFDLVTEDNLMDRIFCAWDKNNEGIIKTELFFGGVSMFLRGKLEEKLQYCFRVYDLNSDGYISKEEMFQLLKNCLVKQPQEEDPDEGVKDLVEIILRKLDIDRDGKVSLNDYTTAIKNEPLLLEAFGQCLPTEGACLTFLSTLQI